MTYYLVNHADYSDIRAHVTGDDDFNQTQRRALALGQHIVETEYIDIDVYRSHDNIDDFDFVDMEYVTDIWFDDVENYDF